MYICRAEHASSARHFFMEKEAANTPVNKTPEPLRTANLSSNQTLIWRVFLPVFGTVFFSGLLLALWLISAEELYLPYSVWWPRISILVIWVAWLIFVKTRLWPLKRIDADAEYLWVTNYWTTVRYPWTEVLQLKEVKKWRYRLMELQLKAPGRFGQTISFMPGSNFQNWMEEQGKAGLIISEQGEG
jgi:hypothetical protein